MKMFKDKKGVEMTFNSIIIAILVLLILVIIILIITGQFAKLVPQLNLFTSCEGRGGTCEETCQPGETAIPKLNPCGDDGEPPKCCIPR